MKLNTSFLHSPFILGGGQEIRTLAPVTRPTPLAGEPLHHLSNPPYMVKHLKRYYWRRGRDSNPWSLAGSLVFKTSSLNHSDTSPKLISAFIILS